MSRIIPFVVLWCLSCVLADTIPPQNWSAAGWQHTMSLYAQVVLSNGAVITEEGSILAAYGPDGICQGAVGVSEGPGGRRLFQMTLASTTFGGTELVFKLLDGQTGRIYAIEETVSFEADSCLPEVNYMKAPMQMHVTGPCEKLDLQKGWNLVSFPHEIAPHDAAILATMSPFEFSGECYQRAEALSPYTGYWVYARESQTYVVDASRGAEEGRQPGKEWHLVGVAKTTAVPAEQRIYQWIDDNYWPVTQLSVGKGYWSKE